MFRIYDNHSLSSQRVKWIYISTFPSLVCLLPCFRPHVPFRRPTWNRYIMRYSSASTPEQVRGIAVHEVLSRFFDLPHESRDISHVHELFRGVMQELIEKERQVRGGQGRGSFGWWHLGNRKQPSISLIEKNGIYQTSTTPIFCR